MADKTDENKQTQNDWEDDDDDWDDWGDAVQEPTTADTNVQTTALTNETTTTATTATTTTPATATAATPTTATTPTAATGTSSWGSVWKPWEGVVSTVLSTASEGIGSLTNTVTQSLDKVIGVPDPVELARINAAAETAQADATATAENVEQQQGATISAEQTQANATTPAFGLHLVSGVTNFSSKVLNTGLDTLEGIGKKTMHILQENDPGLKNKRKMLGLETERPNLSAVLKEAKKDAEQLEETLKELKLEKSREQLCFEHIFENNCGLVHLEALEILSKESNLRLQTLLDSVSGNALQELQETIAEVQELLELEDLESAADNDEDYNAQQLNERLNATLQDVQLQINFEDIVNNWSDTLGWLANDAAQSAETQIFAKGVTALAVTCALQMNKLHKIAELLLVKEHHSTANEVDCIVQICRDFNAHLNALTQRFAAALSAQNAKEQTNALFAELLLALQQIEKAFKLFLPILQIGAV